MIVHPRLPGGAYPMRRSLRGGRRVQAGLADLQELRRRQARLAPPARFPGPCHGPGGAGDDRRRRSALGREPDPGAPRPRRASPASRRSGVRALMEVSGCLGKRAAEYRHGRIRPRPADQRGRPARARHDGRRDADDRRCRAAQQIALELDRCNARRQEIERQIQDEARAMIEAGGRRRRSPARSSWPARAGIPGVIGIVAGRLAETLSSADRRPAPRERPSRRARPARSPASTCTRRIKDCSGAAAGFGGHAAAAGLKRRQRAMSRPSPGSSRSVAATR